MTTKKKCFKSNCRTLAQKNGIVMNVFCSAGRQTFAKKYQEDITVTFTPQQAKKIIIKVS